MLPSATHRPSSARQAKVPWPASTATLSTRASHTRLPPGPPRDRPRRPSRSPAFPTPLAPACAPESSTSSRAATTDATAGPHDTVVSTRPPPSPVSTSCSRPPRRSTLAPQLLRPLAPAHPQLPSRPQAPIRATTRARPHTAPCHIRHRRRSSPSTRSAVPTTTRTDTAQRRTDPVEPTAHGAREPQAPSRLFGRVRL